MTAALLHGIILAFGLILPLGAQNVFVFNQGASQPRLRGAIPVIITAGLCDTLLILLAVLGVSVIVLTMPILQTVIFSLGIIFLLYMGWSIWKSDPGEPQPEGGGDVHAEASPVRHVRFTAQSTCHHRYNWRHRYKLTQL